METPFNVKTQIGHCGIKCGTCFLGNGSVANSAKKTLENINMIGIEEWASLVPEGSDLNWKDTKKVLDWMTKYAYCEGCEKGGGPPNCSIRICAKEREISLCNNCRELDDCRKFDWLGKGTEPIKQNLRDNVGKTKKELLE
jgi:hypothetical protein